MAKLRIITLLAAAALFGTGLIAAQSIVEREECRDLDQEEIVRLSEAFGHLICKNLEVPGFRFDLDAIVRGMHQAAEGKSSPMSEEEYDLAINKMQQRAFAALAKSNLENANHFLATNGQLPEVISLVEGKLQYRVEQSGAGREVAAGSAPILHYTGRFVDGTLFGTSTGGEPIVLPLTQTIPGFAQGLIGMKEGERRTLFVHPDLGYGKEGPLPPNSLLIFEVELIAVDASQKSGEESIR